MPDFQNCHEMSWTLPFGPPTITEQMFRRLRFKVDILFLDEAMASGSGGMTTGQADHDGLGVPLIEFNKPTASGFAAFPSWAWWWLFSCDGCPEKGPEDPELAFQSPCQMAVPHSGGDRRKTWSGPCSEDYRCESQDPNASCALWCTTEYECIQTEYGEELVERLVDCDCEGGGAPEVDLDEPPITESPWF